jgi:hypothetical protein
VSAGLLATPQGALLAPEADQIDRLVAAAYLALPDFELFAAHAMLYFAVVSFAETRQRLIPGSGGEPFLGAGEPDVERAYRESFRRLARLTGRGRQLLGLTPSEVRRALPRLRA